MLISGIQQVGIGVRDVKVAFAWYNRILGFDVPVFEEAAEAGLMLPYTGGQPQSRHAILALNMQGGGGLEIWQYTRRQPLPPEFQPENWGSGIFAAKVKCHEIDAFRDNLLALDAGSVSAPLQSPAGRRLVWLRDPWGNAFEVGEFGDWRRRSARKAVGGVFGALIGVSDMERSLAFYRDVLGYDQVIFDRSGRQEDWEAGLGESGEFRRVLLGHSGSRRGPFSRLLGASEVELAQALDRAPRRIYEGRFWGDLGFIHLCFDIMGMDEMRRRCADYGHPFTVDSSGSFDMGEAAGCFSYIEDPDGTLIEFVETHRIPILKKIGWYLDLRKRSDPSRPLPEWMIGAMGLGRVRVEDQPAWRLS